MSGPLVLSLFPGIGLFDRAFEELGYCVVRGPDLLWGGDIRQFHPPAGRFDGVIGGPPCQAFSSLRHLLEHQRRPLAPNLIPEFERVVVEAAPTWFVMENVPDAPLPVVPGYIVRDTLVRDVWVGGETRRLRRFSFGTTDGRSLVIEQLALHRPDPDPAVLASGGMWMRVTEPNGRSKRRKVRRLIYGQRTRSYFEFAKRAQGLPDDFDLPGFTVAAKIRAVGNGVPLPMGRAVARAVWRAMVDRAEGAA